MIGRGVFKNLWIFDKSGQIHNPSTEERLQQLLKHTKLFVETWSDTKSFAILKKFFKCYISDFDGASELRTKFMETKNLKEVQTLVSASI